MSHKENPVSFTYPGRRVKGTGFLFTIKTNHMTREEYYRAEERRLLDRIAFNERIHCPYVANRHRRELERLRKEHGQGK